MTVVHVPVTGSRPIHGRDHTASSFPRMWDKRAARRTPEGRPLRGERSESSSDFFVPMVRS